MRTDTLADTFTMNVDYNHAKLVLSHGPTDWVMLRNLRLWCAAVDVEVLRVMYAHEVDDEVISLKGVLPTSVNGMSAAQSDAFWTSHSGVSRLAMLKIASDTSWNTSGESLTIVDDIGEGYISGESSGFERTTDNISGFCSAE